MIWLKPFYKPHYQRMEENKIIRVAFTNVDNTTLQSGVISFKIAQTTTVKEDLTQCAEDILLAREAHFPATIADLYKPDEMPDNLRAAHDRNDEVLERIYIGRRFNNDTERLEKLFELYTKMTSSTNGKATLESAS